MPTVSKNGSDTAGGTINQTGNSHVRADGSTVAVVGDNVASHAPCPDVPSHCAATMSAGSSRVRINGIAAVRAGDAASCGHSATGSTHLSDA